MRQQKSEASPRPHPGRQPVEEGFWLGFCIRFRLSIKEALRPGGGSLGDDASPEGQPFPAKVTITAAAAGPGVALSVLPDPQLQGGCAPCCG